MSSNILEALKTLRQNLHNVGSLNNWGKTVLNQGAVAAADMDNFTLVTLGFNPVSGERTATALTDSATKGYLVATPEDYMKEYETISSFFNGQGERVRVVTMEPGMRFECSNFKYDQNNLKDHPLKNGQVAHYDHTDHKILISNNTAGNNGGYAGAGNKLVVVDCNCVSLDGQPVIRFEVVE